MIKKRPIFKTSDNSNWIQPRVENDKESRVLYHESTGYIMYVDRILSTAYIENNELMKKELLEIPINVSGIKWTKEKSFGNDN